MIWKEVEVCDGCVAFKCSACGVLWYLEEGTPAENEMNYCPKCGEKAEEET